MFTKQLWKGLFCLGVFLSVPTIRADVISIDPYYGDSGGLVSWYNTTIHFADWDATGCAGLSPCIVGATVFTMVPWESDGLGGNVNVTYGPNFDFYYPSTGFGDRFIFHGLGGYDYTVTTSAHLYTTPPPYPIPDAGAKPNFGLFGNVYLFDPSLGATNSISVPFDQMFTNEVDIYFAVDHLNPDGGSFDIYVNEGMAPEPSSWLLWGTGMAALAALMHARIRRHRPLSLLGASSDMYS